MVKKSSTKKVVPVKKEWPPFRPPAYFGGNLLLGGLSYLLLRQYARFFIYYGAVIVLSFIPFGDTLIFLLCIASAIDAAVIAGKLRRKEIPEPAYNQALSIIIFLVWLVGLAFVFYSLFAGV